MFLTYLFAYLTFFLYLCANFNNSLNIMKRNIFICAVIALLFVSCDKNDPQQLHQVTFNVSVFSQSKEPIRMPAATILDDQDGTALTDLYIFDGTNQLAHQTNDQEDFGTVTLNLTHGIHNLSFVCTRSTGLSYNAGVLSATSLRPTFGKTLALNVSASTPAQDLTLERLTGLVSVTIKDAFPAAANEIEFVINPRYTSLDIATLCGTNAEEYKTKVSCASRVGQTNVAYSFNILAPTRTEEFTADVTINIYNSSGAVIYSVTIDDVRMAANTKTLISGNLFTAPSASVTVNTAWNADIVGTW